MNTQSNLQRWERYAEWPLAAAALLFLGLFSVQVLARPQGREAYVLWLDSWMAVFDKERFLPGATINSLGKALWWSITTVTTVGYGDVYPVTNTGRIIAVLLMIGGISLVGVVTAALASWIIERVSEEEAVIQTATAAHIEELRGEIRELSEELRGRGQR